MARAKKTDKFRKLYQEMSLEDMKTLRTELDYAIKDQIRAAALQARAEEARKLRDTLKIHDTVKFPVKKEIWEGEVVTISVDKVQVVMKDGRKKSVSYQKIQVK
ncbi:MAG: hypothetical protein PQJ58_02045 [Spirochaetales bacterium]|nr:hypothetical protein [Spirochaetales bacterium]